MPGTEIALPDEFNPEFDHKQLQLDPEAFAIVQSLASAGVVTTISLELSETVSYEQRRLIAVYFGEMSRHLQWWVGDLLNDSEKRDGELFAQLAADTGLSEGALQQRMSVCAAIPIKRRRPGLPFSVHLVVYRLGAREQERWLKVAADEQLTAATLRERIKAATRTEPLFDRDADDDDAPAVGVDKKLVLEVAGAILRDAKPAEDGRHHLIPNEDVVRLRAAFGEEE